MRVLRQAAAASPGVWVTAAFISEWRKQRKLWIRHRSLSADGSVSLAIVWESAGRV